MPPTILTCAVTGTFPTRQHNPALPVTPEEIADACIGAAKAGAAVCHIHVREPATGLPSMKIEYYREVVARLRQSGTDLIINLTTGPGGRFVPMEFHAPSDLHRLSEHVIINCTGYGARALWKDESITPVRGQIAWLPPQEYVHYGFYYHGVLVLARRDGVVVQDLGQGGEMFGWNDDNETPDMAAAQAAVQRLSGAYRT